MRRQAKRPTRAPDKPDREAPATPRDPDREGLKRRTFTGLFWSSTSAGVQIVLKLIIFAVLRRLLDPTEFGVVAVAFLITNFTDIFVNLGVGSALVQRLTVEPRHLRVGFTITILLGAVLSGLISLSAPLIAGFFNSGELTPSLNQQLTLILRVLPVEIFIQSTYVVAASLASRDFNFRLKAGIQAASYAFGYGLVGIVLAFLGLGPWALVIAVMVQRTMSAVQYLVAKPHPKRLLFDGQTARELLYFGGGHSLSNILQRFAGQGDYFVVGRVLSTRALGFYSGAFQLIVFPQVLLRDVLSTVLFPAVSKVQNEPQVVRSVFHRVMVITSLISLPMSIILCVFAPEFVVLLLGARWAAAIAPAQVLALGLVFRSSFAMSDMLTKAMGAVYNRAWRQGVYAACVLGGAYVGHYWGITGVAYGVLAAQIVNALLMAELSLSLAKLDWSTFLRLHLQVFPLAAVVLLESWGLAVLLRGAGTSALVTLLAVGLVLGVTLPVLTWFAPRFMLGKDGVWLLKFLGGYLPKGVNRRLVRQLERGV